ncbi:transcription factor IIIA-like [Silene latifolia]|uniref:transcription factor IIIA-like n=1 Tax=Silene latifolia TaxID=37657 RepID=UPI003D7853DB
MAASMESQATIKTPIFKDIRRYYCQFCGICRSKKTQITTHILSEHPEEMKKIDEMGENGGEGQKGNNTCEECGASFKKPAHLKQHMLSHSFERPFACPVDDCNASYRRKDHLNRHLIQHEGKLFKCPMDNCNKEFSVHGNISRHLKKYHEGKCDPSDTPEEQKKHVCQKSGCGKEFKYASQLQKHEESHVECSEAYCADPSCMKAFANRECLQEHMRSCHQYIICEVCGSKHLRKNYKRHLQSHDDDGSSEVLNCNFEGCDHSFTTSSNLRQHVKAVHLNLKPFACSVSGCSMRFAFKHVRDKHEKSGRHVYVPGDLEEFDEQWRSKPHGGQKRKRPTVDMLMRKRITPPNECDGVLNHSTEYLSWLLSADD